MKQISDREFFLTNDNGIAFIRKSMSSFIVMVIKWPLRCMLVFLFHSFGLFGSHFQCMCPNEVKFCHSYANLNWILIKFFLFIVSFDIMSCNNRIMISVSGFQLNGICYWHCMHCFVIYQAIQNSTKWYHLIFNFSVAFYCYCSLVQKILHFIPFVWVCLCQH